MVDEIMSLIGVGDVLEAVFPDGTIEKGVVVEKDGRLALDEGNNNVHALDGGFPDGTEFYFTDVECDAEAEEFACEELERCIDEEGE